MEDSAFVSSPFDALRHLDDETQQEYWLARELARILGYRKWENFEKVIAKAKTACHYNGLKVEEEFQETTKTRKVASILLSSATVLMPAGFFLGGLIFYGGDPGLGILLLPLGAAFLLLAVFMTARGTAESR